MTVNRQKLRATVFAVAALGVVSTLGVPATTANAASTTCSSASINPNSKVAGLGIDHYSTVRSVPIGSRTVKLQTGVRPFDSKQYGWAEITGSTAGADLVWLDVSNDSGHHWSQCGPFSVDTAGTVGFSRAEPTSTSASRVFRACGRVGNTVKCTTWW